MPIHPGLSASVELTVGDDDTAIAHGSGDVPVLATPRMIALAEEATVAAVSDVIDDNQTTVGIRVQVDHLAPSAVGTDVTAEATVEKIEGRRLIFTVAVRDANGLLAAGRVTRVLVDRNRFMEKCT